MYNVKHPVCVYSVNIYNTFTYFVNELLFDFFFQSALSVVMWKKKQVYTDKTSELLKL
jgi:hypothetical protein